MPTPVVVDEAQIQNSLRKRYESKRIEEQQIFHQKSDAVFANLKTTEEKINGGAGIILQMFSRGSAQGPNRLFAQAGQGGPAFSQITLSPKPIHLRAKWTSFAMQDALESGGSKGGYDLAKLHMDQETRIAAQTLGQLMDSDGFGTLCLISSVPSTTTFICGEASAVPSPARTSRFYKGQVLHFAAVATTGEKRSSAASEVTVYEHTVVSTDPATGTVTVTGNLSTSGVVAGDAVSTAGFRAFDATATGATVFYGIPMWLPAAPVGSGDPLGRYNKPELQPLRYDCTGQGIVDALINAEEFAFNNGMPDGDLKLFVPGHVAASLMRGGMKERIVGQGPVRKGADGDYTVGWSGLRFVGMRGEYPIIPSVHVSTAFLGDIGNFRLGHVGPGLINWRDDGGKLYRLETAGVTDQSGVLQSGYSAEGYSRPALLCDRPGDFLVLPGLREA